MLHHMADETSKSKVHDQIDANLKKVYSATLSEDVPDKFKQLLEQLRQKERKN